ncbi:MAG: IS66 family insertion sequence element accessory protein TnpB [Oligoflexia bacterium]|nr:IS66 family insertion sequence element accessory protein TnpB [Oligoflexia bacterium]
MLTIPKQAKVFLSLTTVDFRRQIPGLKKWIIQEFELDPLSSAYFIFLSRNKQSLKILQYDGQGTWMQQS